VGTLSPLAYKNQRGGNQKGGKILEKQQRMNMREEEEEEKEKRKPEGGKYFGKRT